MNLKNIYIPPRFKSNVYKISFNSLAIILNPNPKWIPKYLKELSKNQTIIHLNKFIITYFSKFSNFFYDLFYKIIYNQMRFFKIFSVLIYSKAQYLDLTINLNLMNLLRQA